VFNFILLLLIYMGIYAILAISQNLITGFTGLLSLSHAAFFAVGSYVTAIGLSQGGWDLLTSLLFSAIAAGILGLFIGLPTLRLKGDYLAIATLGIGEITRNVILNWDELTRGPMGISGLPKMSLFGLEIDPFQKWQFLILVWVLVLLILLFYRRLTRSRLGRALDAIREDEIAALAMGISVTKYKVWAFVVGAMVAGMAGTLWAGFNQAVSPSTFTFMLSVMVLCMVVLGGLGNHWGALAGAAIITFVAEFPRLVGLSSRIPPQANQIIFGLILVLMMIFRPQGLFPAKRENLRANAGKNKVKKESKKVDK
jgi:branched-chain amino acid transport system permease protein